MEAPSGNTWRLQSQSTDQPTFEYTACSYPQTKYLPKLRSIPHSLPSSPLRSDAGTILTHLFSCAFKTLSVSESGYTGSWHVTSGPT